MNNKYSKYEVGMKKGFTLAEVLITLGIIGVVAAMTLPTLIEKHQKKVSAVRLEQTYSQLSQAVLMAQNDHGEIKYWDFGAGIAMSGGGYKTAATNFCKKYIVPYLKISKDRGWQTTFKDGGYANNIYTLAGNPTTTMGQERYYIEMANGVSLLIRQDNDGTNTSRFVLIYADINGKTKPNRMGHDIFLFYLSKAGLSLMPYEVYKDRETLLREGCNLEHQYGNNCGAVIMLDGWEIKDDYPW